MASYKSAIRSTPTNGQLEPKIKDKAQQLQEFFPSWSPDDLQSLLVEVNGDVDLAATRISDGKAEQWGSVSRKKDKKAGHTSKDSFSSTPSSRGDFRGGRGGARGGRGSHARGVVRARGDFRGGRGGHANGHVPRTSSPTVGQNVDINAGDAPTKPSVDVAGEVNPSTSQTPVSWTDAAKPEEPLASSAWGGPSALGSADAVTDDTIHVNLNGSTSGATSQASTPLSAKQISKTPATSKLSWAQIARPHEKPAPPTALVVQHLPLQPPATAVHLPASHEFSTINNLPSTSTPALPPLESEPATNSGWEDPTTVQIPSFEEELLVPIAAPEPAEEREQKSDPEAVPAPKETATSKSLEIVVVEEAAPSTPAPPTPAPSTPSKVAARPVSLSQRNSARYSNYAKIASDQGGVVMPPTPSSIGANLSGISSFGSFGELKSAGVEKVGMQFGSLSLGDSIETEPEPEPAPAEAPTTAAAQATISAPEPISIAPPAPSSSLNSGLYQSQSQPIQTSVSQPVVSAPSNISSSPAQSLQQAVPSAQPHAQPPSLSQLPQQLQQQAAQAQSQTLPSHLHYSQLGLPTHVDQSSQAQLQAQSPQQIQQAQNYLRQNDQSPYGSSVSTGVSSGFHHSPTPPTQDNNGYGAFGSVLGSQSLSNQGLGIAGQSLSSMGQGALGGMGGLGMTGLGGQGLGHQQQQQQSLSPFDSYGYEGGQRNFYDSYQPNTFGRGVLGHDDLKGSLPSQQQVQQTPSTTSTGTSNSLPPSASSQSSVAQSQQSPATSVSSSAQGQPQSGQGPAPAGYHPAAPVPTYYYQPFPHQNSYYGAAAMGAPSNYGYGVSGMGVGVPQPYPGMNVGKYPTIYSGLPGNAPSPAGKPSPGMGVHGSVIGHGGLGVQPQSYGGGLYGQQQGYDDYQHHTQQHHQQQGHQHHNSHGLGLGQDYSKQLYGGQGGLQGYMSGSSGGAGSAGVVSGSGAPRSGSSPETAYKPYAPKDVGVGRGNIQQSQGQAQSQGQTQAQGGPGGGPQGQGYYGGNRFGNASSVGGGASAPQQSAPLYPQGQNDAGYYYQQRQQQYWQ
ncbi:hypothetical protein J3R30DRAFT_3464283 [Lentinula aciculospora]|uniref:RNA polymerase II degradation factor 1 n=1 Tax=Lentinula aciculospora TaxID=153920 RepID=A0A9W9DRD4_9AGAR|nr:hypothetical protein J3R30DRAFT_3464283 [Lentinula aciculospora]